MTWRSAAIVGPTASGKSSLAMALATGRPDVEIVSVDSMQVYREMDIGTAKPTAHERDIVRHHLIDLADPGEEFTVAQYCRAFDAARADMASRGARPLLVGGTGLYLQAVVDDLQLPGRYEAVRAELEEEPDTAALYRRLQQLDPPAADRMQPQNRRRVVRALEVTIGSGRPFSSYGPGLSAYPATDTVLVGLRVERAELDARIAERFRDQVERGFLDEVRRLHDRPGGLSRTARQALGYKELLAHVEGVWSLDEGLSEAVTRTRRFARRQERWFRRDPRIIWIDAGSGHNPLAALRDLLGD
jgi:tRNA dimethylallyltransferase